MSLQTYSHVAIAVSDMERSLRFYRDFLGLVVARDDEEHFEGEKGGQPFRIVRRGVYLRFPGNENEVFLVLDQSLTPEPFGKPAVIGQRGVHHFGMWTDDVDALIAKADAMAVPRFQQGPAAIHPARNYGGSDRPGSVKTTMFFDPDGTIVQADQWLDP